MTLTVGNRVTEPPALGTWYCGNFPSLSFSSLVAGGVGGSLEPISPPHLERSGAAPLILTVQLTPDKISKVTLLTIFQTWNQPTWLINCKHNGKTIFSPTYLTPQGSIGNGTIINSPNTSSSGFLTPGPLLLHPWSQEKGTRNTAQKTPVL